jgi:hypothetical protein
VTNNQSGSGNLLCRQPLIACTADRKTGASVAFEFTGNGTGSGGVAVTMGVNGIGGGDISSDMVGYHSSY